MIGQNRYAHYRSPRIECNVEGIAHLNENAWIFTWKHFFSSFLASVLFRDAIFPFHCAVSRKVGSSIMLAIHIVLFDITTPNKNVVCMCLYGNINEGATSDNNMVVLLFRQNAFAFKWKKSRAENICILECIEKCSEKCTI